eukprot:286669-Rhodomonas_salina.3
MELGVFPLGLADAKRVLSSIGVSGTESIAGVLGEWPEREHLNLSFNEMEDGGARALGEHLRKCERLTHLDWALNQIQEDRVGSLAVSISSCSRLRSLVLDQNAFGQEGMVKLAKGLKCCVALETLNLVACGVGEGGFLALTEMVLEHLQTNLIEVDVRENRVMIDGGRSALIDHAIRSWERTGLRLEVEEGEGEQDV